MIQNLRMMYKSYLLYLLVYANIDCTEIGNNSLFSDIILAPLKLSARHLNAMDLRNHTGLQNVQTVKKIRLF